MRRQLFLPLIAALVALSAAQAFAQTATVVMRNGDRVRADVVDMGRSFTFIVNGQKRSVPIGDVAMLDFTGEGRNIATAELERVNAGSGYVVMRNGETFDAQLQDFTGSPLVAVFSNGRRVNLGNVSRLYLGPVNNVAGLTVETPAATSGQADEASQAPSYARTVVVPGNVVWTNTGISVRRGQRLRIEPSGEMRLSYNEGDVAHPAGALSARRAPGSPIPSIPAGALIGRIGNNRPFSIGDTDQVFTISDNGRLFLGVNDDQVTDNSGNYVVRIWEQ